MTVVARRNTLWMLIVAPTVWALHFLICYVVSAVYCARVDGAADLTMVRSVIAIATLVAVGVIGALTAYIATRFGLETDPHASFNRDTPEHRHRFLGHATLMLSVLSFVAVIYTALPALFFEACR